MKHQIFFLHFCLLTLAYSPAPAQDTAHHMVLSREKLLALEGIFTSTRNEDQSVQFIADTNRLKAKILWAEVTLTLYPVSDLEFSSKEGERVSIRFTKDPDGKVTQMTLNNNTDDIWHRNPNYHRFVLTEVEHTPAQLKPYEGLFTMDGRFIRLFDKDNQLVLNQTWDGSQLSLVPDTSWNFYLRQNLLFKLHFTKDANGNPAEFLAFGRDRWVKAKPAHYTASDVKVFEGKYHLDVDSDDVIQISASGTDLVFKQLWDGKTTTVSPEADLFFYNPVQSFTLGFVKAGDGRITEALGPNNNRFIKMP